MGTGETVLPTPGTTVSPTGELEEAALATSGVVAAGVVAAGGETVTKVLETEKTVEVTELLMVLYLVLNTGLWVRVWMVEVVLFRRQYIKTTQKSRKFRVKTHPVERAGQSVTVAAQEVMVTSSVL